MEATIFVQEFEVGPTDFRKGAKSELQGIIAWSMAYDAATSCRTKEALVEMYLGSAESIIERVKSGDAP